METITLKTHYASVAGIGGIMIWEVGQDTKNNTSLLKAIFEEKNRSQDDVTVTGISVQATNDPGSIRILFDEQPDAQGYWIHYGDDFNYLTESLYTENTNVVISNLNHDALYYFDIRVEDSAGTGKASRMMAASTNYSDNPVLIVNDYTVWRKSRDNIFVHAEDFFYSGYSISSAEGSALEKGYIKLSDFFIVDWFCGDKGKFEITFPDSQQILIKSYLETGGNLFLSGSNIGYDLNMCRTSQDKNFYYDFFKARCVKNTPDNLISTYYQFEPDTNSIFNELPLLFFDDGEQGFYNVTEPDVLLPYRGSTKGLMFSNTSSSRNTACIYYDGSFGESSENSKLIYMTIPYETIYPDEDRQQLFKVISDFFDDPSVVKTNNTQIPEELTLYQNYPNPFNSETTIKFTIPEQADVSLKIFNVLGQKVRTLVCESKKPDTYSIAWNGKDDFGMEVCSGIYVYKIKVNKTLKNGRMLFLK